MAVKKLKVKKRNPKDNLEAIRLAGYIPAVVYGPDQEAISVMIDEGNFAKLYKDLGSSTVIQLKVDDKTFEVLVHDIQRDPVKDAVIHLDFYKLQSGHELVTYIPFNFINEPEAKSGVLFIEKEDVKIKALPKDLVDEIKVDLNQIKKLDDSIHLSDVEKPSGVEFLDDEQSVLAVVKMPSQVESLLPEEGEEVVPVVEGEEGEEGEAKEGAAENGEGKKAEKSE